MTDKRAYFKLDVGYLTNPKVAAVSIESPTAVILHIGCIAYAAQHLTDGLVPIALVLRLTGATQDDADLLVKYGLLIDRGSGEAEVHDYLEHQRSSTEAKGASAKAKHAADARWNTHTDAPSMPPSMPDASEVAMPREREREKERTTSTRPPAARPDTFDTWWETYKRREAKGAAIAAYTKAIKRVTPDELLTLTRKWFTDRPTIEPQFIPLPATWLNNQRWADEPPAPTAAAPGVPRQPVSPWDRAPRFGDAR